MIRDGARRWPQDKPRRSRSPVENWDVIAGGFRQCLPTPSVGSILLGAEVRQFEQDDEKGAH